MAKAGKRYSTSNRAAKLRAALRRIDQEWEKVPEKWLTMELERRFAELVCATYVRYC